MVSHVYIDDSDISRLIAMPPIIDRAIAPTHLFNIPQLDFSEDLFQERVSIPWIRLGAWSTKSPRDKHGVENEVMRQSVLLPVRGFAKAFDKLESIGNVLHGIGKPSGVVRQQSGRKQYRYESFHRFELPFTSIECEPLVFIRHDTSGSHLFINPDLWLFFELEERSRENGIWWDPRRGVEALIRRRINEINLDIVEIRTHYLLKYLQARQMSLLVGHYRQLLWFDPPPGKVSEFVSKDVTFGSAKQGAKAILQNWGLKQGLSAKSQFLQRRLHLWFEIKPPAIDISDPWVEEPPFDIYTFTLPISSGDVAPARWRHLRDQESRTFQGKVCDFMDHVYFRQEVLTKYESQAGFEIKDDGSVVCGHYWGLTRSTSRLGNELLLTSIGDFAEGIPFEEWPHWKQYAVAPPSGESLKVLAQEVTIPKAVNSLINALNGLNGAFGELARSRGISIADAVWRGSVDSLACRQLKWVYPATASDDEFLKRATLVSTLLLDGMQSAPLRACLMSIEPNLHKNFESPPQSLGSRNLLQRLTLVAVLVRSLQPEIAELPLLVKQAETKIQSNSPDLKAELQKYYNQVRDEFAPLAFLYDLRVHGGLAHPPNKVAAATAAANLGLPTGNWHRRDYLTLLKLITRSVQKISEHLEAAV
jgi:hypothetical protein